MKTKILIINNHPMEIEACIAALRNCSLGKSIKITGASNSKDAYEAITESGIMFDVVLLDYNIAPYPEQDLHTGDDYAFLIQLLMPNAKIMVITALSGSFLLYDTIKRINPLGLLFKGDLDRIELCKAFRKIMTSEIYYTQTIHKSIAFLLQNKYFLDDINRIIILMLSQGYKTNSIHKIFNVSPSAIEKRKARIKKYFKIENEKDLDIVNEARRLGYI